ncbi:MAG: hypothetical protein GX087_10515 [Desulfobulbaceae bacterium]|nr:hypothetical protein [Desulfobulbaceae bacterium]
MLTIGGYEVDLLATMPNGEQWLVQVCLDLTDPQTRQRELLALQDAHQERPQARCLLLALVIPSILAVPPVTKVKTWLLGEPS